MAANSCRRFHLERTEDLSGMSGVGVVAYGIIFMDGIVALRWATDVATTVVYDRIEHVEHLHGHDGRTKIVYD